MIIYFWKPNVDFADLTWQTLFFITNSALVLSHCLQINRLRCRIIYLANFLFCFRTMTEPEIIANSGDILQPMRDDDVLRYRDILAKHLPANLFAHHFLAIQHRWKDIFSQPANETLLTNISPKCMNKFYAPRTRNIENCTFVSISNEMSSNIAPRYCMFVFTLEWPPTELMSCLRDSMHIQWQNEPLIEALSNKLVPIVTALLAEKGRSFCDKWTESSNCVWLSRYEAAAFDVK